MSDNNETNLVSFIVGFFIGAIVGAVTALLLAPQSGEETRGIIREKSIELKDKAVETSEELARLTQERANELQKRGQVILEEQKERISAIKKGDVEVPEELDA